MQDKERLVQLELPGLSKEKLTKLSPKASTHRRGKKPLSPELVVEDKRENLLYKFPLRPAKWTTQGWRW